MKTIIKTSKAPDPIGPYNQAILLDNLLFVSGQICINPETGELDNKDLQVETRRVMQNLKAILAEAGFDFSNVIKTSIFLTDMNRFSEVNEIYGSFFDGEYPARETVQVAALPRFVNVEISVIASG
jgi:2-iminobutanoate/2-iminopropanoate deaminase